MPDSKKCRICGGDEDQGRHGYLVCIGDSNIPYQQEGQEKAGQPRVSVIVWSQCDSCKKNRYMTLDDEGNPPGACAECEKQAAQE